jgi:hypothetical protein
MDSIQLKSAKGNLLIVDGDQYARQTRKETQKMVMQHFSSLDRGGMAFDQGETLSLSRIS